METAMSQNNMLDNFHASRMLFNTDGFDNVISLGYNCEVSFRIQDYGKFDSFPFSWIYILGQTETYKLLSSLSDTDQLQKISLDFRIESRMFYSKELNVTFHTTIPHDNLENLDAQEMDEFINNAKSEILGRYTHLAQKFCKLLNSDQSSLFILKICSQRGLDENIVNINKILSYFGSVRIFVFEPFLTA